MEQQNKSEETQNKESKFMKALKNIWSDKLKCLYILTLTLQILFLILQFVPIVSVPTHAMFGEVIKTEEFSMMSFSSENGGLMFFFILFLALFGISIKSTLSYFVKKGPNKYTKFGLAKTGVILLLLWYVLIVFVGFAEIDDEFSDAVELFFGAHLYWIVAVALLVLYFIVGSLAQERKEEEKVAQKVQAELDKKAAHAEEAEASAQTGAGTEQKV